MHKQSLNQAWRFYLGDVHRFFRQSIDYSTWRVLDLPHDWSIELDRSPDNPSGVSNGWFAMGRAWYIKEFEAPEAWRGKKVMIEFEGVYMNAEVWLNDNFLGRHPYGYTTFTYDLAPYLKFGGQNKLVVRVDNSGQTNSRWYSGSGIYRPVSLYIGELVHVAHWGVAVTTPEISAEQAVVHIETKLENESDSAREVVLESHVYAPDGGLLATGEAQLVLQPGRDHVLGQDLRVRKPVLWSPETPALYRLETVVRSSDQPADTETTFFGIRSLAYSAEQGFLLNGKSVLLKGGCVHHDDGVMGAASYPDSEERKVRLLKDSGFNAIRCAHNPPAPSFLDACDRLGMLVIDESFDCWREGKNPFDYHVAFDDWWQRDTASMVMRDRNHPSVVIWSIGNEVLERDGRSNGSALARMQAELVRQLDPTRPVTAAINNVRNSDGRTWESTDGVFAALDIGGYNYLWEKYPADHERKPQRIMMGTESFPLEAYDNWMHVVELPYVIGDFVWTSMDYLGESGIGRVYIETDPERPAFLGEYPWHQAYCGDIDLAGFKRPQSYYRDILWGNGEPLYIAVHTPLPEGPTYKISRWGWPDVAASWTWPGREGQTFQVDIYSAFPSVELFLNGSSLGMKNITSQDKLIATFEVPYEPGELKVVGYEDGRAAAEKSIATVQAPAAIRLAPEKETIQAAPESLVFVIVEVVDENGFVNPNADHPIYFTVKGNGVIAAVGSGNPTSTESYRGNQRRAFHGRCVVVVKSNGEPGEICLRAQADGLDTAEILIKTV